MISIFIRNYHQNQALSQNQFWETVLQNNFGNVNAVRLVLISPIMWGQTVSTSYKNNSFNSNKAAVGKIRFGGNNLEKAIFSGKRALLSSKRALFSSKRALFLSKAAHFLPRGHFFNTKGIYFKSLSSFSGEKEQYLSKRALFHKNRHDRGWAQGGQLSRARWALPTIDVC